MSLAFNLWLHLEYSSINVSVVINTYLFFSWHTHYNTQRNKTTEYYHEKRQKKGIKNKNMQENSNNNNNNIP